MALHSPRLEQRIEPPFLLHSSPWLPCARSLRSPIRRVRRFRDSNSFLKECRDTLYRRPDVDISAYSKIMIGEPAVEFSKNWNPRNYGKFGLSAAQLTKIRVDLAAMAKSVFAKSLSDGGYEIVTEADEGVLVITPNIVNVFINAPDVPMAGQSRTYTMDAGSATLALQVNDAVAGTLLAVVFDPRRSGYWTIRVGHVGIQSSGGRRHAQGLGRTIETRVGRGARQIDRCAAEFDRTWINEPTIPDDSMVGGASTRGCKCFKQILDRGSTGPEAL